MEDLYFWSQMVAHDVLFGISR